MSTLEEGCFFVDKNEEGLRLDKLLFSRYPNYSRTYFQELIAKELVLLNGKIVKKRTQVYEGDEIEIDFMLPHEISLQPEAIALDIVYEDESLIAINKPAGMVVHPGAGNFSGTFVNALLFHCQIEKNQGDLRPGIVHRLDKDTTGILLAAKTEFAQRRLVEQFSSRTVKKTYLAICCGNPGNQVIETLIGRDPIHRQQMSVLEKKGKIAITEVETQVFNGTLSLVKLHPLTGRTHQLRVHLKAVGTPILGDQVYGSPYWNKTYNQKRQLLHAQKLMFSHPVSHKMLEIEAKIPNDMQQIVRLL